MHPLSYHPVRLSLSQLGPSPFLHLPAPNSSGPRRNPSAAAAIDGDPQPTTIIAGDGGGTGDDPGQGHQGADGRRGAAPPPPRGLQQGALPRPHHRPRRLLPGSPQGQLQLPGLPGRAPGALRRRRAGQRAVQAALQRAGAGRRRAARRFQAAGP